MIGFGTQVVQSLGGTGLQTQGGSIFTEDNTGTQRNVLDDGSGNGSVAGGFTAGSFLKANAMVLAYRAVAATMTTLSSDFTVDVNATAAAVTVTLQPTPGTGRLMVVKKNDASVNNVTVQASAGGLIDGGSNIVLNTQNESAMLQCIGGNNWKVISANNSGIL